MSSGDGAEGFSRAFFDNLRQVEDSHFWFEARNRLLAWALARYFPAAATLLEVGSGTGQVAVALRRARPGLRITASDAFLEGLQLLAARDAEIELVLADARRLPWDAEFDVAGAFDVLEHVVEHETVARQLAQAVVPGGGVLVTVPQHAWLWSPVGDYSGHVRRYSRQELIDVLQRAGLRIERVTSFVSVLLPVLVAMRVIVRSPGPVDPMREFRLPRAANVLGAIASALDRAVIRAGISLPVGASLLAVARRPPAPGEGAGGRRGTDVSSHSATVTERTD